MSLFANNLPRAIEALSRAAARMPADGPLYNAVAMAIAGFQPSGDNTLWRTTCSQLRYLVLVSSCTHMLTVAFEAMGWWTRTSAQPWPFWQRLMRHFAMF